MDRVGTPRGELVLRQDGDAYEIIGNGTFLMDTRDGRSERLLVRAALDGLPAGARVLIGGLGVGFSLAEAVSADGVGAVTVVEREPAVLGWHAGPLAAYSAGALRDPRVRVVETDLVRWLSRSDEEYDAICLDVDNGPDWTMTTGNAVLYGVDGLAVLARRLAAGGRLAVWSAAAAPAFEALLRERFVSVRVLAVPVARGQPDVVYVAEKPG